MDEWDKECLIEEATSRGACAFVCKIESLSKVQESSRIVLTEMEPNFGYSVGGWL